MADVTSGQAFIEHFFITCNKSVSHLQLACCSSHCAVPWQDKKIRVYTNNNPKHPLELTGHHGDVSALVFGTVKDRLILCSASEDYVIVWDIDRCFRQVKQGVIASGRVIGTLLGRVVHLSLCLETSKVAACSGSKVFLLNAEMEEMLAVFKAHLGPVTASEFCPWDFNLLVSVSEDRTFKVWDVNNGDVLFQSAVLSVSPLLSLFFMKQTRQVITGSGDGQLWCHTLPVDHKCRLVTKLDLPMLDQKHQKNLRTMNATQNGKDGITHNDVRGTVETEKPVLGIWAQRLPLDHQSMHRRESCVWIGSSDGLYLLDLDTSELLITLPFKGDLNISIAGSWTISPGHVDNVLCLVTSVFKPVVVLLEVNNARLNDTCFSLLKSSVKEQLSVVPSSPLMLESPLNDEMTKLRLKPRGKTGGSCQKSVKDQPLVFHTQVKSSGYNAAPYRAMFKPQTSTKKKSIISKTTTNKTSLLREYPSQSAAPSMCSIYLSVSTTPTTVSSLHYLGDGKQILCGLGDSSVLLYNSSLNGDPAVYTGHRKTVNSVCWSHSKQCFLSSSEDPTLSIWTPSVAEPVLTMGSEQFLKPIRSAQFYYLDKFLLMGSGSNLLLYLYHLDTTRDDIKRYKQRSKCKLTGKFCMKTVTDITSVSAINDFYSYIVLAAGADRTIQVFDMNRGCVTTQIPDAHCRAVHHLAQNKGSLFSTQTPDSYNLFLSCAVTDGLKMWDLRSARCVRRYESHINRCHHCTATFSPCGRFIATGSEDHSAYIYDTRSSGFLLKLQRHSDTVLNVAFNPANPELLTGTLNGNLALFHSVDSSLLP